LVDPLADPLLPDDAESGSDEVVLSSVSERIRSIEIGRYLPG
jgi:hypothetical protein